MRTFIAIEIDEAVRERIAGLQSALRKSFPRLRWSDPSRIHLTLKFLGKVDEARTITVRAELDRIAASTAPFAIAIRQTGIFPPTAGPTDGIFGHFSIAWSAREWSRNNYLSQITG